MKKTRVMTFNDWEASYSLPVSPHGMKGLDLGKGLTSQQVIVTKADQEVKAPPSTYRQQISNIVGLVYTK